MHPVATHSSVENKAVIENLHIVTVQTFVALFRLPQKVNATCRGFLQTASLTLETKKQTLPESLQAAATDFLFPYKVQSENRNMFGQGLGRELAARQCFLAVYEESCISKGGTPRCLIRADQLGFTGSRSKPAVNTGHSHCDMKAGGQEQCSS